MRDRRMLLGVIIALLTVFLALVYYFVDPMQVKWMPRCIWKVATGSDCPGCGSQRMAHALMHGDIDAAWRANAYALCMLPLIVLLIWIELFRERYPRIYMTVHSPAFIGTITVSVFVWWIVRNCG